MLTKLSQNAAPAEICFSPPSPQKLSFVKRVNESDTLLWMMHVIHYTWVECILFRTMSNHSTHYKALIAHLLGFVSIWPSDGIIGLCSIWEIITVGVCEQVCDHYSELQGRATLLYFKRSQDAADCEHGNSRAQATCEVDSHHCNWTSCD